MHAPRISGPKEKVMDQMKRRATLHSLFAENPDLADMIREADDEGAVLYGRWYVPGVDFMLLTLEGSLLVPEAVYKPMRATMIRHPSLALQN
jgi:hypothetical protein